MTCTVDVVDPGGTLEFRPPTATRVVVAGPAGAFGLVVAGGSWFAADGSVVATTVYVVFGVALMTWAIGRWRSRVLLNDTDLVLVGLRHRTFPLTHVIDAASDYHGLSASVRLDELSWFGYEEAHPSIWAFGTWNLTRWTGGVSKGDRIAALVRHRAALARDEESNHLRIERSRSLGDIAAGGLGGLFAGGGR